ncbi:O-antigen ligase family protein [Sphingorhabdus sp.]|uniref:O-antigen ligase family protein n=1 Tax=Sphingorhabdus sp. TaxID=1902408 RepID=UPI0032B7E38D
MTIVPWDFATDFSRYRVIIRSFSLTPTLVQLAIILIGMRNGHSIARAWHCLPRATQIALPLLSGFCMIPWFIGAEDPGRIPMAIIVFLVHVIFALLIFQLIAGFSNPQRKLLAKCIALGVIAYCIIWGVSLLFFVPVGPGWISQVPGLTHVRGLSFFVVCGFYMALASLPEMPTEKSNKREYVIAYLGGFVSILLAFWSGSRGSIVAILGALSILLWAASSFRIAILKFSFLIFILGALASLALPIPHPSYGIIRFTNVTSDITYLSSGRTTIWLETLPKILDRPIFGWGLDQFQLIRFESFQGFKQPHNIVLQSLISIGFVGSAILAVAILPILRKARLQLDSLVRVSALGMIATTCILAMYDAALYYNYPLMMLAVAVALAFAPDGLQSAPDK